ncbi:MAG: multidrug efflux RND transporter permease subunit [Rhizobiaceae bacterium]|nr:multidrug efflux RND transporter permease subunit [Rhizobiaceae bacterium]
MNISTPFIRRPIATSLLTFGILLLGALGYKLLPVAALPAVDFPTIEVVTSLPGGSPDVVASSVTAPLEAEVGQIPGLLTMSSVSSFGRSAITLRFSLNRDIDSAAQDVQAAIGATLGLLPQSLPSPPTYSKINPADAPIAVLAMTSDALPLYKVHDFASTVLVPKLSQLDGIGLASIEGGQKRAVRVQIVPEALAALGMSLEDVRAAVQKINVNAPKGSIDGKRQTYTIAANDQLLTAEPYADAVLAYKDGAPIRIRDIGTAVDSVENARLAGWYGDKPAILLEVRRQPGSNIIETVDRVKHLLPELRGALPPAVDLVILSDRTETIRASVEEVQLTFLITVLLVVAVIFIYIRDVLATLIPSLVLPLSLIATFGVMFLCGYSLNNLSLMALTIAAGFVVDDAIIMIENIARHRERGLSPFAAAIKGSQEIGFTVISLTVSLVAVFLPLLLMSGVVGRLFREFAVTLSVAVIISAVISLTLTPMMCAQLLGTASRPRTALMPWLDRAFDAQLRVYDRSLRWVLRHRTGMLMLTLAALAASIYLYVVIPKGFLPQQDTGIIIGVTDTTSDMSFQGMVERQRSIAEIVGQDPDVATVASFVGTGTANATSNSGQLSITLKPRDERKSSADEVIQRLREATRPVPGVTLFAQTVQDIQLDPHVSRTQYQYILQDTDFEELSVWVPKLVEAMQRRPELRDVASDLQSGGLQTRLTIDRDKAAMLGVSPKAIDEILYSAFGQRQISTIFTQLDQYRVILEVDPRFQLDESALDALYVPSETGRQVPLSSLVEVSSSTAPLSISRLGRFPVVTLSFNLAPGISLGEAVNAISAAEREIALPSTIATSFAGTAAEFQSSLTDLPLLVIAAIVVMYIVLGVLYESYIHPITILSTLPSAGVGALLALYLLGYELNLLSLIGLILLIGIVKKNAIMMINFALDAERLEGLSVEQSIYQACLLRFRPIMMTTMAAILGALPLALGGGSGSELRNPMGIAMVGGLLLSQFLTLYSTPVVYIFLSRLRPATRSAANDDGPRAGAVRTPPREPSLPRP